MPLGPTPCVVSLLTSGVISTPNSTTILPGAILAYTTATGGVYRVSAVVNNISVSNAVTADVLSAEVSATNLGGSSGVVGLARGYTALTHDHKGAAGTTTSWQGLITVIPSVTITMGVRDTVTGTKSAGSAQVMLAIEYMGKA